MKGTAKSKVVTSGRLTGGVQVQLARKRRMTPNPGPAACPEPAYSLYSTDSEDQVTSLHKGLDRCAALLSGILQAEKAEALPGPPRAAKGGAAKSRPSTSLGKKAIKNTKTDLRSHRSVQRGAASMTQQSAAPAARVKLRPPQRRPPTPLQPHSPPTRSPTLQRLPPNTSQSQVAIHPHQTSIPPAQFQLSIPSLQSQISFPQPQTQTPIPLSQSSIHPHQTSIPPPQPQTSIPSLQSQISIPSLQSQISFPRPQTQTPIPLSQSSIHPHQVSIPPPQPQTSIPSLQSQISFPRLQTQTPIPLSQSSIHPHQVSIPPPQPQTSIPPAQFQLSIPSLQSQISFPPPQPQIPVPLSQSQTSIHPHQVSIPSPQPQTSLPPQSQLSIPSLQTQLSIPSLQTPISPPQPQTSICPPQAPPQVCRARDEEEFVPVRDISTQSSAAGLPRSHIHMPDLQPEPGRVHAAPQEAHSGEEKVKTVQYLLGELKAAITGRGGGAAERLLHHLEQTVSNIQTEPDLSPLRSQNTQLRRRVRILNQQLKEREKAERQQNTETLCLSAAPTLQEELAGAQWRLQELQGDLAELRKALQDAQSRLTDSEAENALIRTDLEAARSRLQDSEREKSELASLAQERLEEIGNLNRILQSHDSSALDTAPTKLLRGPVPAEPATERISHFLMSLGQLEPAHAEHAIAEREGGAPEPKKRPPVQQGDASSRPGVGSRRGDEPAHSDWSRGWRLETLSQCDVESVRSGWSTRSGSTFDTRDEAAFRDGLAALDASIASLQKTIQLDLGR